MWIERIMFLNNKKVYRNGVELATTQVSGPAQYGGTGTLRLGATYSTGGNSTNGFIAIARMYGRVLSRAEVNQNFQANRSRFGI
jgi:hypothetical protein